MHSPIKTEGCANEVCASRQSPSKIARQRLLSLHGEPLFIADWMRTLMIHYDVDLGALQQVVPFQLDLRDGHAFVSAVAFTLNAMRPRIASRVAGWLLKPISTHHFLNVRTYVRVNGETGIYFLAEWLSNRLSVILGPMAFGLPYRFGRIEYSHESKLTSSNTSALAGSLTGRVADGKTSNAFAYTASVPAESHFRQCDSGSLTEWLMERYTAFTKFGNLRRFFRVWHQPWLQVPADVCVTEQSLLEQNWPLFRSARIIGANFSPALTDVWMGWPHRVSG
jgi:uncharacterized protein YqjF (DUF2071 family)